MNFFHARLFRATLELLAITCVLLWPALMNGQPFFMSDTSTYIRAADAAVYKISGRQTDWTDEFIQRFPEESAGQGTSEPQAGTAGHGYSEAPVVLLGRSVYYGSFLYLSDQALSIWLVPLVQALLTAIAIRMTLYGHWDRNTGNRRRTTKYLFVGSLLALATPVAFFTSFLMPDIFSALAILAAAHVFLRGCEMKRSEFFFWFGVMAAAALFHSANILILGSLVLLLLIAQFYKKSLSRSASIAPIAACAMIGIAGELAFSHAVGMQTGTPPIRAPFVTARLVADGPGTSYLKESCPESGFLLCQYLTRIPAHSDSFLWSLNASDGVFSTLSPADKRRLSSEELPFALAVFRDRPFDVIRSSSMAVWDQATRYGLEEFNYDPHAISGFQEKLPARILQDLIASSAGDQSMPISLIKNSHLIFLFFSLAALSLGTASIVYSNSAGRFVAVIMVGISVNLVVCGAMSTPHDRYSSRALWLIPLVAFAVVRKTESRAVARPGICKG